MSASSSDASASWPVRIVGHALVDPRTLTPHPHNPKIHPASQDAVVEASLRELGWLKPLMVNEVTGHILDGHERHALALSHNMTSVPVDYVQVAEADEGKVLLTLDPSGQLYRTHWERWVQLTQAVVETGPVWEQFLAAQVVQRERKERRELGAVARPQDGAQQRWQVEPGQIWHLGRHRVLCGDSTDMASVERLMAGEEAALVLTDPPYTVAGHRQMGVSDIRVGYGALKQVGWDQAFDIGGVFPVWEQVMAADVAVYVWTQQFLAPQIWSWMEQWSAFTSYCVWCKPNPVPSMGKRHWTWATELVAYGVRGEHVCNFPVEGHALNWWESQTQAHGSGHPTEKPVAVLERPIAFSSAPGDIVYDGFLGSGSTLLACDRLGRVCYGVEQDQAWVAITLQRYVDAGGEVPRRVD